MHRDFGEPYCNHVDYLPCKTTSLWTGVGVSTKGVCSSHSLGFDLRSLASGFGCTINGSRRFFLCFFSKRALCGIKKSRKERWVTTSREAESTPQPLAMTCPWSESQIKLKNSCMLLQKSYTQISPWFWREKVTLILHDRLTWTPAYFLTCLETTS